MSGTGEIIQEMRVRSGFTQKSLAAALHVTDKAISKWERGICLPDTALLPKLALLLDTDIDILISKSLEETDWVGLIHIDDCDLNRNIYDKPLIYYILSHFLLLGLRDIHVPTDKKNKAILSASKFNQMGFRFVYDLPENKNVMMINHPWFLFGSDLTQQFQSAMLANRLVKLVPENQPPIFYFIPKENSYLLQNENLLEKKAVSRTLGRGMIAFDMSENDQSDDVATFVRTYQKNSGMLIGSLEEISYKKGYIDDARLSELADDTPYSRILLDSIGKPQVD